MKLSVRIPSRSNSDPLPYRPNAPVSVELDATNLSIEGEIPNGLNGVFLKNSPTSLFHPAGSGFPATGAGKVHALYFENGAARYRNRWVRTEEYRAERAAGHPLAESSAGAHPANSRIVAHAGHLLAMGDAGRPYRLDWGLHTLGPNDFQTAFPGGMLSHSKLDPETGEMILLANETRECRLDCLTVDPTGKLARILSFDSPWPSTIHDIAVTRNYIVVIVSPFVLEDPAPRWRPVMGTAVALIPRRGTEQGIRWFETRPFFHLHVMNAFEKDRYIELQLPWYSSWREGAPPVGAELRRLRINLENRTIIDEQIDDCACEFPRIDDRFAMRENRFGYTAFRNTRPGEQPAEGSFEGFARYDFKAASRTVHTLPPGEFVGEPVFVPARNAGNEGEGYLMAIVFNALQDRTSLRIYDAQNLYAPPLAQIQLPCRVPAGCHASWVPHPDAS